MDDGVGGAEFFDGAYEAPPLPPDGAAADEGAADESWLAKRDEETEASGPVSSVG